MKPGKPETHDRLTHADVLVMALLAVHPTHGYGLVMELGRHDTGEGAAVSRAQIYYSLKKLQRLRLITAVKHGTPAAGPERETYRLSAPGRQAMSKAIARPERARRRPPIPFQMWLIMVGEAEPKDRAAALRARRKHLAEQIERQSQAINELGAGRGAGETMKLAVASHTLEVLRLEQQLLTEVEPMLGR